jgi:hypothetical protein
VKILSSRPSFIQEGTKPLLVPNFLDIHRINETHRHVGLVYIGISKDDDVKLAVAEHNDIKWFDERDLYDPKNNLVESVKFYAKEALKVAGEK